MKLFAQQGYGTGTGPGRILAGLEKGYIQGAILSPKDTSRSRIDGLFREMEAQFPKADRLFDPQYYATVVAHESGCRIGKLEGDDFSYFQPRRRSQLEAESAIQSDLKTCLKFQLELATTAVMAPNVVIRQSFNSIEAVIGKNFIRNAANVWREIGDGRPLYVTLAVDSEALQDKHELQGFLTDITLLENPPDGFYIIVNNTTSEIGAELVDFRTLAGWMMLNHSLSINGFEVLNGYSDILSPFLAAAGANAGATGWWNNLKVFSLSRFQDSSGGGRRPVPRYLSKNLLNSIRFDELQRLRIPFPEILNGLETDPYFGEENGSQPDGQVEEVLQCWDAISSFWSDGTPTLQDCKLYLNVAAELYGRINASPGSILRGRSNKDHVESLADGLDLFLELSEIKL